MFILWLFLHWKKGTTHDDDEETNEDFMTWSRFLFLFIQKSFYVHCVDFTAENRKMNCQCFIRSNTYSIMNDTSMLSYSILQMSLMLSNIFEWHNVKIAI